MARPKVKIDLVELEKLAGMQCTYEEIAAFFGVSTRTIERRCRNTKFLEAMERGRSKGKLSVRRALFRQAPTNIAAAIFLAKNLLGYKDVLTNEHSGPDGSPIQFTNKPNFKNLSDEELKQLRAIAEKTLPDKRN